MLSLVVGMVVVVLLCVMVMVSLVGSVMVTRFSLVSVPSRQFSLWMALVSLLV